MEGRIVRIIAVVVILIVAYDQLTGFIYYLGFHQVSQIDLRPWNEPTWYSRVSTISYAVGTVALLYLARALWRGPRPTDHG